MRPVRSSGIPPAKRLRDNVFVERLWRSVKYEEVYLRAYDSVGAARGSLTFAAVVGASLRSGYALPA